MRRPFPVLLALALLAAGCPPAHADQDVVPRGAWPLDPRPAVVTRFDPPDDPYGSGHRGVDLLGRPGEDVRAGLGGTVSFAGSLAGRGVVSVQHGDLRTTYEPVTATVHVGDHVATGQPIGILQLGPSHCRPRHCLHWGLVRGTSRPRTYLDPLLLVGAGPVRLLPLIGGAVTAGTAPPPASYAARWGPTHGLDAPDKPGEAALAGRLVGRVGRSGFG